HGEEASGLKAGMTGGGPESPVAVPEEVVRDRDAERDRGGDEVMRVEHRDAEREDGQVDDVAKPSHQGEFHKLNPVVAASHTLENAGVDILQRRGPFPSHVTVLRLGGARAYQRAKFAVKAGRRPAPASID